MKIPDGMIFQNDPELDDVFRADGCRARTLMAMPEIWTGKAMTLLQLQLCIATSEKKESVLLAKNATAGKNEHMIPYYTFQLLDGSRRYFRQVGVLRGSQFVGWQGQVILPEQVAFTELHWETDYPDGHYTLGDSSSRELWDPWCTKPGFNPWDKSGKKGWTINKKRVDVVYAYRFFKGVPSED